MDKRLLIILLVGIIVKISLSFSTFHPDILAFQLGGSLISSGKILDLYEHSLPNTAILNYPPAIYWYHGIFNFLFSLVFGPSIINNYLEVNETVLGDFYFNIHLLLLKIPYLIFDVLAGFFLVKLFTTTKEKLIAFTLWTFNPVNLYATYMMGQFDIIPVFFTVLFLVYVYQRRWELSALALGLGMAFKIYPLFLLIPLVLSKSRYLDRLKLFGLGVGAYVLTIMPYIFSSDFRSTALVASQTLKSLYAGIAISGGVSILLFPMLLIFFYLYLSYHKQDADNLWKICLMTLLVFFVFTHHHPQWILWLSPFLIIDLVKSQFKNLVLVVLVIVSFTGSLFFFDPSLTVSIFSPLIPSLYNLPSLWEIYQIKIDLHLGRSLMQSGLTATALYYFYLYFLRKKDE